jgi:hypothetical protein
MSTRPRGAAQAAQHGVGQRVEDRRVERDQGDHRDGQHQPARGLALEVRQRDDEVRADDRRAREREEQLVDQAGGADPLRHALALGQRHAAHGQGEVGGDVAPQQGDAPHGDSAQLGDGGAEGVDHRHPQRGVEPLEHDQGEDRAHQPRRLEAPLDVRELAPLAGDRRDQAAHDESDDSGGQRLLPARHVRTDGGHHRARLAEALEQGRPAAHGPYQRAVVE